MTQIHFQADTFQLVHAGESIGLLPKEYALFHFLYNHPNQSFSREELLNRVWPMEAPTDRTVDDHVYRLRKKLNRWSHLFSVDSIRGYGYKLVVKEASTGKFSQRIPEATQNVLRLLETYHGLGMGDAMQTLAANRDVLGIQLDSFYSVFMHFVNGDFQWIVETETLSFWEKVSYMICIYYLTQEDQTKTLYYCKQALARKELLPRHWGEELEIMSIALSIETGLLEQAKEQVKTAEKAIEKMDSTSFTLIFLLKKTMLSFALQQKEEAQARLLEIEELLGRFPLKREMGFYTIFKGLHKYLCGITEDARHTVDEGIHILKTTRFVPHLLQGVRYIVFHLRSWGCDEEYLRKYEKLWQQLASQYKLAQLEQKISPHLNSRL